MRTTLPVILLLPILVSACAPMRELSSSGHEFQPGPLKVHPGLYDRRTLTPEPAVPAPAPVAAAPVATPAPAPTPAAAPAPDAPAPAALLVSKDLKAHLRAERSFYFALDQSELKAEYDPVLNAHAGYLAEHQDARVRIEGHADERGGQEYNRLLSLRRAEIVRAELIKRGAPEARVEVKPWGETRPKLKGHDEESWAENRRADVVYEVE